MIAAGEAVRQAFEGRGPLVAEMLAQRARDLARPLAADEPAAADAQVLRMTGTSGSWALPVASVTRIEPLAGWLPLPGQPPAVLGLALLAGRRCLLVDPEVVLAAAPSRPPCRPGHAVLLRDHALAVAVDRADSVLCLPRPELNHRLLADGSLMMAPEWLVAVAKGRGAP